MPGMVAFKRQRSKDRNFDTKLGYIIKPNLKEADKTSTKKKAEFLFVKLI